MFWCPVERNPLQSFDVQLGFPLEYLNSFESDIPELCCYILADKKSNCSTIDDESGICLVRNLPIWYFISISLFVTNLVVFLFRIHKSYKDCLSILIQSINLTDILLVLHYLNRTVLTPRDTQLIFTNNAIVYFQCLVSSGIFIFAIFNHLFLCVAHSCIHLYIQKSAIFNVKIIHGLTLSIVSIVISAGTSSFIQKMNSLTGILCLPFHAQNLSFVLAITFTCLLLVLCEGIYIVMNVLTIMSINSTRNRVGRQKSREEQNLTIRIILSVVNCFIYYGIIGSILCFIFTASYVNQDVILLMDIVLFLRSISTAVLYTFATKSFGKLVRSLHCQPQN